MPILNEPVQKTPAVKDIRDIDTGLKSVIDAIPS
jgi:hypothetical protein